jgi:hypothetical protein
MNGNNRQLGPSPLGVNDPDIFVKKEQLSAFYAKYSPRKMDLVDSLCGLLYSTFILF